MFTDYFFDVNKMGHAILFFGRFKTTEWRGYFSRLVPIPLSLFLFLYNNICQNICSFHCPFLFCEKPVYDLETESGFRYTSNIILKC